jgi:anti-anti-sigma regulatory factor
MPFRFVHRRHRVRNMPISLEILFTANPQSMFGRWNSGKIMLDFSRVDYINSSEIAIVIEVLLEEARAGTQRIGILGLSPHFQKVFTMVGINKYAAIHVDEASALQTT